MVHYNPVDHHTLGERLNVCTTVIVRLPNPRFLDNLAIRSKYTDKDKYTISKYTDKIYSKVFLLFLYLRDVLFKNLDDATLSPLGNLHNMQIKAAITENSVFVNISVTAHGIEIMLVSIHMFFRGKESD